LARDHPGIRDGCAAVAAIDPDPVAADQPAVIADRASRLEVDSVAVAAADCAVVDDGAGAAELVDAVEPAGDYRGPDPGHAIDDQVVGEAGVDAGGIGIGAEDRPLVRQCAARQEIDALGAEPGAVAGNRTVIGQRGAWAVNAHAVIADDQGVAGTAGAIDEGAPTGDGVAVTVGDRAVIDESAARADVNRPAACYQDCAGRAIDDDTAIDLDAGAAAAGERRFDRAEIRYRTRSAVEEDAINIRDNSTARGIRDGAAGFDIDAAAGAAVDSAGIVDTTGGAGNLDPGDKAGYRAARLVGGRTAVQQRDAVIVLAGNRAGVDDGAHADLDVDAVFPGISPVDWLRTTPPPKR
jgi:hypothetical protein